MGFQMPNFDDPTLDGMDDEELEAELQSMQGVTNTPKSKRSKPDGKKSG
jgi:hypothetical protein